MKIEHLLPGLVLFALGFVILFGLLGSVGAMAKSKQFAAFRDFAVGQHGGGKRALFFVSLALLAIGMCGTFAGVSRSDYERANACTALCLARGNTTGRIGPSRTPDSKRPRPACLCEGGAEFFETPADSLAF
ncbi:MAG: hypothetical protein ACO1OB_27585 [Archangium sp.]